MKSSKPGVSLKIKSFLLVEDSSLIYTSGAITGLNEHIILFYLIQFGKYWNMDLGSSVHLIGFISLTLPNNFQCSTIHPLSLDIILVSNAHHYIIQSHNCVSILACLLSVFSRLVAENSSLSNYFPYFNHHGWEQIGWQRNQLGSISHVVTYLLFWF